MIDRLKAVYLRYAMAHMRMSFRGPMIVDADGVRIGAVDRMDIADGRLHVTGWAQARRVALMLSGARAATRPGILRQDVSAALGIDPAVGFELELPFSYHDLRHSVGPGLILHTAEDGRELRMPLELRGRRREVTRLSLSFLGRLVRLSPLLLRWLITRDRRHIAGIKRGLGLDRQAPGGVLNAALFRAGDTAAATDAAACTITIVLPVYNAFDLLEEVLDRVRRNTDLPWRLIVVEDCSSDARVRPFLRDWCTAAQAGGAEVDLIENPENRGRNGAGDS